MILYNVDLKEKEMNKSFMYFFRNISLLMCLLVSHRSPQCSLRRSNLLRTTSQSTSFPETTISGHIRYKLMSQIMSTWKFYVFMAVDPVDTVISCWHASTNHRVREATIDIIHLTREFDVFLASVLPNDYQYGHHDEGNKHLLKHSN